MQGDIFRAAGNIARKETHMNESYTYKPVRFFLITNVIIWTSWLGAAYLSYQPGGGPAGLISILELIGLFSPFGMALWMIFTSNSTELKQSFYDRLLKLKLIKPWTIPAIFLIMPAAIVISVALSHVFFKQSLSQLAMVKGSPFVAGIIPAQLLRLVGGRCRILHRIRSL